MAASMACLPHHASFRLRSPKALAVRQREHTQQRRRLSCYVCSSSASPPRSSSDRIIKRIHDLPVIANHHAAVPILRPFQDDLPFAVSLEICEDEASFQLSSTAFEHPMCELLYFLDGSGSVTVRNGRGNAAALGVSAGDSVLTAGQNVVVQNDSKQDATGSSKTLSFLRVILPLQYVVENAHSPQIAKECRDAAAKATKHWSGEPTFCPQVSAVVERIFAREEAYLTGGTFMYNPHVDVLDRSSNEDHRSNPRSRDAGHLHKVSLLDAPAFQMPNQQNRLALVLDPVADDVPFTFGVEIFPPGFCTPPHVHDSAYEMFLIISGMGATAFCNGRRSPINPGDVVVFRPGSVHGIDTGSEKVYCLELLLPNQDFAEMVRRGQQLSLDEDDSCILAAIGCGAEVGVKIGKSGDVLVE